MPRLCAWPQVAWEHPTRGGEGRREGTAGESSGQERGERREESYWVTVTVMSPSDGAMGGEPTEASPDDVALTW